MLSTPANQITPEYLQILADNGIINLDDMLVQAMTIKNNKILKEHPFKISQDKKGRWHTYIKDATAKGGRRYLNKGSIEDIYTAILESKDSSADELYPCVKTCFPEWLKHKRKLVRAATMRRYKYAYEQCITGSDFENIPIKNINEDILEEYLAETISKLQLKAKAFDSLLGILRGVFTYCMRNHIINYNPILNIDKQQLHRLCPANDYKPVDEQVVSNEECWRILERFEWYKTKKPDYIPVYAFILGMLTGMRPSEISALSWKQVDFQNGYIIINYSDRTAYNTDSQEDVRGNVKNNKIRTFPINDEIKKLFIDVKEVELRNGTISDEFVFMVAKDEKITKNTVELCATRIMKRVGCKACSMTALRKTLNSQLEYNGVPQTTRTALLGHTPQVNTSNYSFDVTPVAEINAKLIDIYDARKMAK